MLTAQEWDRPRPVRGAASYYPPLVFPCLAEEQQQQKQEQHLQQELQQHQGGRWGGPTALSQRSGGLWGSQGVVIQRDEEKLQNGRLEPNGSNCHASNFYSAPVVSRNGHDGITQDETRRYTSETLPTIEPKPVVAQQSHVGLWGGPGTEIRREALSPSTSNAVSIGQQSSLNTDELRRQNGLSDRQDAFSAPAMDASFKHHAQDEDVRRKNGLWNGQSIGSSFGADVNSTAPHPAHSSAQRHVEHQQPHLDTRDSYSSQPTAFASVGVEERSSKRFANEASLSQEAPPAQDVDVRTVHGEAPRPWATWQDVSFSSNLLSRLIAAGFPAPTPIQQHSWAIVTKGHDLIGIAKTGSGKTLAFLLPAFSRLLETRADPRAPPAVLVLAPTRELACQIEQEAKTFGSSSGIKAVCLYGGAPKGPQLAELRNKPQLVVATPGRLNDLLDPPPGMSLAVDVKGIKFLVLDEADRMLDMGFEPQIRKIISGLPQERQTMMFTATWPPSIRRLAAEFLKEPVEVRVGEVEQLSVNADIEQSVIFCNDQIDRQNRLDEELRHLPGEDQAIIFVNTKRMCDSLSFRTPNSSAIHGDKDQRERDSVLAAFKSGSRRILVATDVAARCLDIKAVRLVVNFEPPNREEDYVHRVGRTGRAGLKGRAVTLLTNEDGSAARFIADVLGRMSLPIPPELERKLASGELRSGGGGRARSVSRGPSRRMDNDDFDFGGMGGSRFSGGGFGRSFGGDFRNECPNDCPT